MKKESIGTIAQILDGMRDAVNKLETAFRKKDNEELLSAKREILQFQEEIGKLL